MSFVWQNVVAYVTGKDVDQVAVKRENMAKRVDAYTSKFDENLSKKWDDRVDQQKVKERKQHAQDMTNAYYDIATDFYEYGWGQSFHFSQRYIGESFDQGIARHEHYLALRLRLGPGMHAIDLGCGVGGPLREISRFSGAKVMGVNNNAYQVSRALRLNTKAGLQDITDVIKADFMNLPFAKKSIDAAYAIEATCHAPDRTGCFRQVYEVLKDGGYFAGYEWTMTDRYDAKNATHNQIKHGIEEGNSLPTLTHYSDVIQHLKNAGFEVIDHFDMAEDERFGAIPWYSTFLGGCTPSQFKHTKIGRICTNTMCSVMETLHIAPAGTTKTARLLCETGDALAESGRTGIFTPMYFFLCRKPAAGEQRGSTSSKAESSTSSSTSSSTPSSSKKSRKE